jgi:hypothetical protein
MTDRYTHVRVNDERAALDLLADLAAKPDSEQARATGTDDAVVTDAGGALGGGAAGHKWAEFGASRRKIEPRFQ